jgi:hypothetical protein
MKSPVPALLAQPMTTSVLHWIKLLNFSRSANADRASREDTYQHAEESKIREFFSPSSCYNDQEEHFEWTIQSKRLQRF